MNKTNKELFEIDRQFCLESQTDGHKAWERFLSEDIIFGGEPEDPYILGKKNITQSLERLYQSKDLNFNWEPLHAFISDDKTLGVTTGTYRRTYRVNEEIIHREGKYTTTWKKISGEWKIVFDMGN